MDRMSPTDAGFCYAETETSIHLGSVAAFGGPPLLQGMRST